MNEPRPDDNNDFTQMLFTITLLGSQCERDYAKEWHFTKFFQRWAVVSTEVEALLLRAAPDMVLFFYHRKAINFSFAYCTKFTLMLVVIY